MFQYASSVFIVNDSYVINLVEKNAYKLVLLDPNSSEPNGKYIAGWDTGDRRHLKDVIVMTGLFIEENETLINLYQRLGYKENEKPLEEDIDILFDLAIKRLHNCKINIAIWPGSDMLPTIAQQFEFIKGSKMEDSIAISTPYSFADQ